jgi:AcrR family transcriptional regulator
MCPRTAEQVEQIRDERRRALLRAARIVFARKGFAAAKISDVAAEAGISHGLVYHYFPEKESLFAATVEEAMQGWQGLVTLAQKQPGEPWDRLVYLCTEMITGQVAPGAPVELTLALIAIVQGLAINRLVDPGGSLPPLDVVLRILRP